MAHVILFSCWILYLCITTSEICVQCPIWLFSVFLWFRASLVYCSRWFQFPLLLLVSLLFLHSTCVIILLLLLLLLYYRAVAHFGAMASPLSEFRGICIFTLWGYYQPNNPDLQGQCISSTAISLSTWCSYYQLGCRRHTFRIHCCTQDSPSPIESSWADLSS